MNTMNQFRTRTEGIQTRRFQFQPAVWFCIACLIAQAAGTGCRRSQTTSQSVRIPDRSPTSQLAEIGSDQTEITPVVASTESSSGEFIIGLDADMTSGSAKSGEAIRRGVDLALDEINRTGGLLGKSVKLEVRDHRGNPDRGVDNILEFSDMPNLLAVVGGIHTPVATKELSVIHEKEIVYLGPWAAGTQVVSNGYNPNFVFRVSVRDEYAGGFLVDCALKRKLNKMGLLLERTAWGRSNETAIIDALSRKGMEPTAVGWFNWGERKMAAQISELLDKGSEVILLVSNPLEGAEVVRTLADMEESRRVPIISHWGISAGDFFDVAGESLNKVDISFIQSFSFCEKIFHPTPDRWQPATLRNSKKLTPCEIFFLL